MGFAPNQPYNHLPLLPPQGVELETKAVLKKTVSASRALAELKTAGRLIPNQREGVLLSTLGLQEAKLSSEIENIVTTQVWFIPSFGPKRFANRWANQRSAVLQPSALVRLRST